MGLRKMPIVEMGSNSNGTYVKWENGLMVCFGTASITTAVNTAWGVLFHSGMKTFTFPAAFAATPSCSASCRTGGDYWAWVVFTLDTSATSASYVLVRPTKQDSINNSDVAWHAIGMWK